jgi:mono/diheme cytochrome c family protein
LALQGASSVHDPKAQYAYACAACHGVDGTSRGPGGLRLPGRVLADRRWLAARTEPELLAAILDGKGAMPAFRGKLSQEEAKRLLNAVIRPMARKAPR